MMTILIKVCASGDSPCYLSNNAWFAFHEIADAVSIFPVPFSPASPWESAYLIETCGVPGFGDDFRLAKKVVQFNGPDHWRMFHWSAVFTTAKNRSLVKSESIDVHFLNPEAQ